MISVVCGRERGIRSFMPVEIKYDFANTYGGTPASQSKKEFVRVAPNACALMSRISAEAEDDEPMTPCLQNSVMAFITITGDWEYYDVIVTVAGYTVEQSSATAAGGVKGGLSWGYTDDKLVQVSHGTTQAWPPVSTVRMTPVSFSFPKRLPNRARKRLGGCTSAGGMTLKASATPFSASVHEILVLSYSVQFVAGWLDVGADAPILDPFQTVPPTTTVPGSDEQKPMEPQHWYDLFRPSFYRVEDGLQDVSIRRQIEEHSFALERDDVKTQVDQLVNNWLNASGI